MSRISPFLMSFGRLFLLAMALAKQSGLPLPAAEPVTIVLPAGATSAVIQGALDSLPDAGGEVVLPAGTIVISRPIVLRRDHQSLRGAGDTTLLRLADGANCPVLILGEPVNDPRITVKCLRVSGLFIDGNRTHQKRELWQPRGEGSEIRNNGITVQNVSDSTVERVTCTRCRSGGLVTTRGVRRLTVSNYTAFDNEFDGLACYDTMDSRFTGLNLYDNPGAGISLDLGFNHNVVSNAALVGNDLGIFMRASRYNRFYAISIRNSRHFGVFMAHTPEQTVSGWQAVPGSECTDNSFTNIDASGCGGPAFHINDITCVNNVIAQSQFSGNLHGGLSLAEPHLVTMR